QPRHADRLETALGSRYALDRPRRDRLGNTLELMMAEVAQAEQIAEQPPRRGGDDDHPRLGQGLKAGRKIRRVSDYRVLPQRTLASGVADHHQAARDANAHGERFGRTRLEPRNGRNDVEPRPHGPLGIVFVRARIAEIGQYAGSSEITEEAIVA